MLHLNIRSIPDHFLQLTSLLNNLNIELKIIAISETWIKPFHINYNIPNYSMEQDFRLHKRTYKPNKDTNKGTSYRPYPSSQ